MPRKDRVSPGKKQPAFPIFTMAIAGSPAAQTIKCVLVSQSSMSALWKAGKQQILQRMRALRITCMYSYMQFLQLSACRYYVMLWENGDAKPSESSDVYFLKWCWNMIFIKIIWNHITPTVHTERTLTAYTSVLSKDLIKGTLSRGLDKELPYVWHPCLNWMHYPKRVWKDSQVPGSNHIVDQISFLPLLISSWGKITTVLQDPAHAREWHSLSAGFSPNMFSLSYLLMGM